MLHAEREGKTALSQRTIVRVDLNDQVYDSLKERLLTREFGGGEKLSLQTLADELGVSRSPVHHALTRLVSEGLVLSERRGYMVRPLTARLMDEAHEARLALELHAAELTVGRLSSEQLQTFRRLMERTLEPVEEEEIRDARSYMLANKEFHEYQIDLACNSLISEMYRRLCIHQLMERTILVLGVSAAGDSTPEHTRIVEAFEAGDLQSARAALRSNVETGKRIAREAIERADGTL
jgi:DNA-binding GntR family transcriptional regulator